MFHIGSLQAGIISDMILKGKKKSSGDSWFVIGFRCDTAGTSLKCRVSGHNGSIHSKFIYIYGNKYVNLFICACILVCDACDDAVMLMSLSRQTRHRPVRATLTLLFCYIGYIY